jgi:hypothetical protein
MGFPNTPILDLFNRADENPLAGNWTCPLITGEGNLQIVSNVVAPVTDNTNCNGYYSAKQFSVAPGMLEIFCTIAVKPEDTRRFSVNFSQNPATASHDGYTGFWFAAAGTDTQIIYRRDNTVVTQLGATQNNEFAVNDVVGMRLDLAGNVTLYQNGTALYTQTDTTYTGLFYLAINIKNLVAATSGKLDSFGGGGFPMGELALLGVG